MRFIAVFLLFLICSLFSAGEASANCTTPCTKAQITTDITTNWPDNTIGSITPALLRSTVTDLLNSYLDVNGSSSFACSTHQFLTAIATLSSYTCAQPAIADVSGWGTGVATALGVAINTAGGPVVPTSALTLNGVVYGGGSGATPAATAAGTNGQLFLGVTSGAPQFASMSQDCTITNAGVITCTKTNNVAFATSATTDTTNASNISSGTLAVARGGVDQAAWATYSPTATCGAGTITTSTTAGRYKLLSAKTLVVQITLSISTLGTCSGNVTLSVPPSGSVNGTGVNYPGSAIDGNTAAAIVTIAQTGTGILLIFASAPTTHSYYLTVVYETT